MLPKASARVVPRQAGGEQGLAGPWRTVHQQVVTAGRRYLQRPLGRRLPFHLDKVGTEARRVRLPQIGRAACRERVCQYVEISVVAVQLKKKNSQLNSIE